MCVSLTETGLLALVSLLIGFTISFCKIAEQSRCKDINLCCGLIGCNRDVLTDETILEMKNIENESKNVG
jgi:hypothetical protein